MKERHKAVPASYLIVKKDNQILFTRRINTGYEDGKYMVPSGHVEAGESPSQAIIREANEEVGITVKKENLRLVHVMYRSKKNEESERVDFFFTATAWDGKPVNKEPNKCDELRWFSFDNLPDNVVPYLASALRNIDRRILFSEFGWE